MKILVTGASGFIGSHIVEEGMRRGFEVYAGIRSTSSRKYLPDNVRTVELTLGDQGKLAGELAALGKFDYIIHNAGVTRCRDVRDFERVNCDYTRNFVAALQASNTVPTKFLLVSSAAAYGPGNADTLEPVRDGDVPTPDTLYGISKLNAERVVMQESDFPWVILRPTGVYGPRERDYFVFLQTVNRHLEPAMGMKTQHLTFVYVSDLVNVMFLALESAFVHRAWFVTDGKEYTNREYAAIVKKHLNRRALYLPIPLPVVKVVTCLLDALGRLFGFAPTLNKDKYKIMRATNWKCEFEPLHRDLHFEAAFDLDAGIEACVAWYRKNGWL